MSSVLSNRLFAVLKFVHTYSQKEGYAPTYREVGDAVEMKSVRTVEIALRELQILGLLSKEKVNARTLKVTEEGKRVLHAPLAALLNTVNATPTMIELIANIACHDYDHAFATARGWADSCDGKREE